MSTRHKWYRKVFVKVFFIIGGILVFLFCLYFGYNFFLSRLSHEINLKKVLPFNDVADLDKKHPGYNFLADIHSGNFSLRASENALTFVSMYLTSGGDIYSVYDFINLYPELAFLKAAEKMHPDVFEKIKSRRVPYTYSDEGLIAFLTYLEALESYGYKDITITGALVYQYSKKAFYMEMILKDKLKGESLDYPEYTQNEINESIKKAIYFTEKASNSVADILKEEVVYKNIATRQAFNSLLQFAYGLRYLEALNTKIDIKNEANDIFSFAKKYTNKGKVPETYLAVYFLDAASLLLLDDFSLNKQITEDLKIFFTSEKKFKNIEPVVTILNSRYKKTATRYLHLDMYGYKNVVRLSKVVPEFKDWLIINGWKEGDFK